jgi:hypothetical protein
MSIYFMGSACGRWIKFGHHTQRVPAERYKQHRKNGIRNLPFPRALAHVQGTRDDEDVLKKYYASATAATLELYGDEIVPAEKIVGYVCWLKQQYFSREDKLGVELPDDVPSESWHPNTSRTSSLRRDSNAATLFDDDADIWSFLPEKEAEGEGEEAFYAPSEYVEPAREFFGGVIDLDPCGHPIPQRYINARVLYTRWINGLELPWNGRIWFNPPFKEDECKAFLRKAMLEVRSGNAQELVTLVESSKPSNEYFIPFMQHFVSAVCIVQGRAKWHGFGTSNGPRKPYVMLYTGERVAEFRDAFKMIGYVFVK